ncbi:MAG TPA: TolC family protein [Kofleriaceae bacterium]|nr:TolC family protein [Kofleriaceae bacterium]
MHRRRSLAAVLVFTMVAPVALPAAAGPRDRHRDHGDDDGADDRDHRAPGAGDVQIVSIEELVAVAIRQSPTLAEVSARRRIRHAAAGNAGIIDEWQLTATAGLDRNNAELEPTEPYTLTRDDRLRGTVELERNLPTGGLVGVRVGGTRVRQNFDPRPGAMLDPVETAGTSVVAGATFRQPLVRGLGPGAARAERHKADLDADSGEQQAEVEAGTFVRDLVAAYWELAYAQEELRTARESLDLANEQLAQTRAARGAGGVAENALNAVKYQAAVREEAVLRAQLDVEARSLDVRMLVGLDVGVDQVQIQPADALSMEGKDLTVDEALGLGLGGDNPALVVARAQQQMAEIDVDVAQDRARPRLDLDVDGALVGTGLAASDAFSALRSANGYEVGATLTFQLSLGRGGAAGVRAAELARSEVKVDRATLERTLTTQIITAVHQVDGARERAALAAKAIDVAGDNLKAERALFLAGRTTNFDVLQRQAELADAQLRLARAQADYHQSRATLQLLTGTILDEYRIPDAAR